MDKISGFKITSLRVAGFKSFAQPTELTFGNPTVITGGNGRGKSSIADAIAYAVTGLPFFAERNIDRLHSESDPELFVTMRFVDDKGVSHELTRSHKGSRTGIVFDGQELRQLDLTKMFGEKDVFLSIFNPLYFIEELSDEGKNLLQRYLPMIPQEKVLAELAELKMNRVSISLYDIVKSTGEVKDVFRFEYNGRRYDRLSLAEKIRAGMEVSELMKRLTGRNYPVFVDNMESVDDLNNVRPTGQVLMAKCVSRTELNIRPIKPIVTEMLIAA